MNYLDVVISVRRHSIFRVAAMLLTLAIPGTSFGVQPKPYCEVVRETLRDAVAHRLQDLPDYSETGNILDEWRDEVAFIFDQPRGFNYERWINEQVRRCRERTPSPNGPLEDATIKAGEDLQRTIGLAIRTAWKDIQWAASGNENPDKWDHVADETLSKVFDAHVEYAGLLKSAYKDVKRGPDRNHGIDTSALLESAKSVAAELDDLRSVTRKRKSEGSEKMKALSYYADAAERNARRIERIQ